MLGIVRRIWAPEWKYITEPPRPHPKCYFKFTLNSKFEDHRFGSEKKKKKKKKNGIPFDNGKFSCLIYN